MTTEYIPAAEQKTAKWSGGTTTELYIYPRTADYKNRDFLFRLSSATVDDAVSSFTKLDGYDRTLILLSGSLRLVHKNIREATLGQYDKDCFYGGYETTGYGSGVTDFNLMAKEGCPAKAELCRMPAVGRMPVSVDRETHAIIGFYALSGDIRINCGGEKWKLADKDFFTVEKESGEKLEIEALSFPGRLFVLSVLTINETAV
ncbi:MAG TPA: HutD family protein [Clostridia bacterium]|nr:HutD family protein [Clostridia bacterium]